MNEQQYERAVAKLDAVFDGYQDSYEALKQYGYEPPDDDALASLVECGEHVRAWIDEAAPMLRKVGADAELMRRMRSLALRVAEQTATILEARAFLAVLDEFSSDVEQSTDQWQADELAALDAKLDA